VRQDGAVTAGLGSLVAFGAAGALTTAAATEYFGGDFVTYVTGDPQGLLELEALGIFGALTVACLAVPIGCVLALAWGRHGAAWATGAAAMLLVGALVVIGIVTQTLEHR
jgi:hypothetical protein